MKAQFLAAAGALALAACGSGADDAATDATTAEYAAAADAATVAMDAQTFADTAAASDMYEIEAGKLAQEMGSSDAVKDFGGMMVEAHTKSSADLKSAAAEADGVTVDPQLTAKHQSDLDALRNAGEMFDAIYKTQQVAAHEAALALLTDYGTNGDSEPLKAFATNTRPVVEEHLMHARELP